MQSRVAQPEGPIGATGARRSVAGELDPLIPLERAREFAAGFADGRLVVMPRTAHDIPASAIREHISGFLEEASGPSESP